MVECLRRPAGQGGDELAGEASHLREIKGRDPSTAYRNQRPKTGGGLLLRMLRDWGARGSLRSRGALSGPCGT